MTEMYGANTDVQERTGGPDDGRKVINIRAATHANERFDRVVFDLSGGGEAGWHVSYTESANLDGSGDPVEVPGGAILTVILRGINWTESSLPEYGGAPIDGVGPAVVAVRWGNTFEGDTLAFIGTASRLPFRVGFANSPTRVYVDVVHP